MDITPLIPEGSNIITGYSNGSFLINNIRYYGNIIISRYNIWPWRVPVQAEIISDNPGGELNNTNQRKSSIGSRSTLLGTEANRENTLIKSHILDITFFEAIINDVKINASDENAILLVGTGHSHITQVYHLQKALLQFGIIIETMTTDAACRTYNILLAEGRRVYAALIVI